MLVCFCIHHNLFQSNTNAFTIFSTQNPTSTATVKTFVVASHMVPLYHFIQKFQLLNIIHTRDPYDAFHTMHQPLTRLNQPRCIQFYLCCRTFERVRTVALHVFVCKQLKGNQIKLHQYEILTIPSREKNLFAFDKLKLVSYILLPFIPLNSCNFSHMNEL